MSKTTSKMTLLELAYPPISNQEAEWIADDKDVQRQLEGSDFYMIAGRAEARFENFQADIELNSLSFTFVVGEDPIGDVTLKIDLLQGVQDHPGGSMFVEYGEKLVRIWDRPKEEVGAEVLDWFTTEKLVWERSRGRSGIEGFDNFAKASTYELLYVGIAKVGDSFERLIKNGHKARTKILSNEKQRKPGARVSDETYLFMFRVKPTFLTTFDANHDFEDDDLFEVVDNKKVVADAEKAFIKLLDPNYNRVKYLTYPRGKDGVRDLGLARYLYAVCENISFETAQTRFNGGRDTMMDFVSNEADCIFIEEDTVTLLKSSV